MKRQLKLIKGGRTIRYKEVDTKQRERAIEKRTGEQVSGAREIPEDELPAQIPTASRGNPCKCVQHFKLDGQVGGKLDVDR